MRILIIEQEKEVIDELENRLREMMPGTAMINRCNSVPAAIDWLRNNATPGTTFSLVDFPDAGKKRYQERFLVTVGNQMKLVTADQVAYFFTDQKIVYLITFSGAKHHTGFTLERLEQLLNPVVFFRINRQFIINISAIVKMKPASKSRLDISLKPETGSNTITSFGRTDAFCKWMLGGFTGT